MARSILSLSNVCHYCGEKADTEDHIVPKCLLPKPMSRVPYWFRSQNVVPACKPCNNFKAHFRSNCFCSLCVWAWNTAKGVYDVEVPETIEVKVA